MWLCSPNQSLVEGQVSVGMIWEDRVNKRLLQLASDTVHAAYRLFGASIEDPEVRAANDIFRNSLDMHSCLRDVVVWLRDATKDPDPDTIAGLRQRLQTACAESGHALESNGELHANAGIALSLTLLSLSLPEDSRSCVRGGFPNNGFPRSKRAPVDQVEKALTKVICERVLVDRPGWRHRVAAQGTMLTNRPHLY